MILRKSVEITLRSLGRKTIMKPWRGVLRQSFIMGWQEWMKGGESVLDTLQKDEKERQKQQKIKEIKPQEKRSAEELLKCLEREEDENNQMQLIEELVQFNQSNWMAPLSAKHLDRLTKVFRKRSGRRGRKEKIVSVAWAILKLGMAPRLSSLMQEIGVRVVQDQWYVTIDEGVKALEIFCCMEECEFKQAILSRVEFNMEKMMHEETLKVTARVLVALQLAGRSQSSLWEKLQSQIVRSLSMQSTPKDLINIFRSYALTRNGSSVFYEQIQQSLLEGSENKKWFFTRRKPFLHTGEQYALMIETYAACQQNVEMLPDFVDGICKTLNHANVTYPQLSYITTIVRNLPLLLGKEDALPLLQDLLHSKRPPLFNISQLCEFHATLEQAGLDPPLALVNYLDKTIIDAVNQSMFTLPALLRLYSIVMGNKSVHDIVSFVEAVEIDFTRRLQYSEGDTIKQCAAVAMELDQLPPSASVLLALPPPSGNTDSF